MLLIDGVVVYPVMQVYGSLALEDNFDDVEVVLDRYRFAASASVLSSSRPKKQT